MQISIYDLIDEAKEKSFKHYHDKNPDVFQKFKHYAIETKAKGFTRFSARGLFQVMRWNFSSKENDSDFKFNNNYTPYYVRLLEKEMSEFIGFFEKRTVKKNGL